MFDRMAFVNMPILKFENIGNIWDFSILNFWKFKIFDFELLGFGIQSFHLMFLMDIDPIFEIFKNFHFMCLGNYRSHIQVFKIL